MASEHSDAIQVKPEELYDPEVGGLPGAPKVHIDDVEEVKPTEVKKDDSQEAGDAKETPFSEKESAPVTHETETVKTTYTEEDPKLSTKAKIKDKMVQLGDKLRPKEAVESKNADPHPGML